MQKNNEIKSERGALKNFFKAMIITVLCISLVIIGYITAGIFAGAFN